MIGGFIMKKEYIEPAMDIAMFEYSTIMTLSVATAYDQAMTAAGEIEGIAGTFDFSFE